MINIVVNSIIGWLDENSKIISVERVLWISPDGSVVVLINTGSLDNLPYFKEYEEIVASLQSGTARKLEVDPYSKYMNPGKDFLLKHKALRDKAWAIISDIVFMEPDIYDKEKRGRLITDVSQKTGIHKRTVYRNLKRYWIKGKIMNALLPEFDNCGGLGKEKQPKNNVKLGRPRKAAIEDPSLIGVNVLDKDKKMIKLAIREWYTTSAQNPMTLAYQKMIEDYYNIGVYFKNGVPIPIVPNYETLISFRQFRYWADKELSDLKDTLQRRIGERNYNLKKRPLLGNATLRANGPGSVFEIDATPADFYLVSAFDRRRIIGRPVVYIVIDVFSRLVVGLYVGLEGPSWIGAMMALENATMHKVAFCAEYGITINESDWPSHYLPSSITADRGEMESQNADNIVASLGVRVDNTPPYRGDLKGIVEQHFRVSKERVGPFVPGQIRKELRERGEPDYRLDAKLTIKAFTSIIILSILEHNKKEIKNYPLDFDLTIDKVPPIPLELWKWGIANRSGYLHEKPSDIVRLSLMPQCEASVTRQGIRFENMLYSCDVALIEGWYERATNGSFRVPISYDPRNCNYIYITKSDGQGFIKCQLLQHFSRFKDKRLEDIQDQLYCEEVESHKRITTQIQIAAETNAQIQAIVAKEKQQTEAEQIVGESKASRLKEIRMNRKSERDAIREQEGWELDEKLKSEITEKKESEIVQLKPRSDDIYEPKNSQNDSLIEILKRQREQRRNKQ